MPPTAQKRCGRCTVTAMVKVRIRFRVKDQGFRILSAVKHMPLTAQKRVRTRV